MSVENNTEIYIISPEAKEGDSDKNMRKISSFFNTAVFATKSGDFAKLNRCFCLVNFKDGRNYLLKILNC